MIIHRGPSAERPDLQVRVQLSGIDRDSKNAKTGPMVQAWILLDQVHPMHAVRSGDDTAICGSCPMRWAVRGTRRCYVPPGKAPASVWRSGTQQPTIRVVPQITKPLRLGAYGDPAMVPTSVWRRLLKRSTAGHTAYTHQWRTRPSLRGLAMASVDTPEEAREAQRRGWRTFRTRAITDPILPGEIVCPASAEGGKRSTCATCLLCNGRTGPADRRKHIVIIDHGSTAAKRG